MSTKIELEAEIKSLKKQVRDLKKDNNETVSDVDLNSEVWGVYTYKEGAYQKHKIVQLKFNYETKKGLVVGEMDRDFVDIYTALGYITKNNNEHIMKKAQGRD